MRRSIAFVGSSMVLGAVAGGAAIAWRRNPRVGTAFVNSVVNPWLLGRGLSGSGASEIGTLEHIGRRSGIRRLTPVHPEPTPDGFRILVPLGPHSEWARNVLAAGHCRLLLHDVVYDLDEPRMIRAQDVEALPSAVRGVETALSFQYLDLRRFGAHPGTLEPVEEGAFTHGQPGLGQPSVHDAFGELVSPTP